MVDRIKGPSAWLGKNLWMPGVNTYWLSEDDVAELEAALAGVKARNLSLEEIRPDNFPLPGLKHVLKKASDHLENGTGVFYPRGLPVDRFSEEDAARLFWGIGRYLGYPVSQSAAGERIFQVRDRGFAGHHTKARGPNTRKALTFHTDRCDVIAFLCYRKAKRGGENLLAASGAVHNRILETRPDLLATLYRPFYWQRHNVDTGNQKPWCALPVFARHNDRFMANIMRVLINRAHDSDALPDLTKRQREALDLLEETARDPEINVRFLQEPGDMLFLNNFVVLHSRTEFEDESDEERKRLLLRLWLSVPNSRELPPVYAELYRETGAGAIRGGMRPSES